MIGVAALVNEGARQLGSAAEARTLLAHAAGVSLSGLAVLPGVGEGALCDYRTLVARRRAGEPVQYLTGRTGFRTVEVAVAPGVFIPRPETEVMTGWAIDQLALLTETPVVVELCAGSGAISLAIATEAPGAQQYAVELSPVAAAMAQRNLDATSVSLLQGDMADAFPELDGTVDLVIANPPYVPQNDEALVGADVRAHEPALAVFAGPDGLNAMPVVSAVAARLLRPGGLVCIEHAETQANAVQQILAEHGFDQLSSHRDLTGRPRFVTGVRAMNLAG